MSINEQDVISVCLGAVCMKHGGQLYLSQEDIARVRAGYRLRVRLAGDGVMVEVTSPEGQPVVMRPEGVTLQ